MSESLVLDISRETIWTTVESAAPLLLISLIIGLIISIFQTVTFYSGTNADFCAKVFSNHAGVGAVWRLDHE